MKTYYVYILRCADGSFYTGVTNHLQRRLEEHQRGNDFRCYTFNRRPVEMVFYTSFQDVNQAIAFEKQIKGWNRKKKMALISGNWEKLPGLSKRKSDQVLER